MNVDTQQKNRSFESISQRLKQGNDCPDVLTETRTRASVAMILSQLENDVEILFIQRAAHDNDPWSGHLAFPGGKLEAGELECQAACRETNEEIGIDLRQGHYLGRLSDIIGSNLPVRVSCCLYGIDKVGFEPVLNEEVRDLFWVTLSDLRDPGRHLMSCVSFDEKHFDVPAIRLPYDNIPVLWGITYRLVMQFLSVLEDESYAQSYNCGLPATVEINEEVEL